MKILTKNFLVLAFLTTVLSTQDTVITEDGEVTTLSDSPDLSTELDDMTDTQIKSSLSKLVGFMDTDKDKNISYEELLFWVFRSIHSLDARNSKQTFREADSNRDDQLAFDEFLTYELIEAEDQANYVFTSNRRYHRWVAKWQKASVDGVLMLSMTNFMRFKNPFKNKGKKAVKELLEMAMKDIDKNEDGEIDQNEYLYHDWGVVPPTLNDTLLALRPNTDDSLGKVINSENDLFELLDMNKDWVLSEKELILWLSPESVQPAMDEVKVIYAGYGVIDDIESMDLPIDLILYAPEILAKSKAMEHGKLLRLVDDGELEVKTGDKEETEESGKSEESEKSGNSGGDQVYTLEEAEMETATENSGHDEL